MNRFKCPACGRNQYTAKDTTEGCVYCVYKGPLELMDPAGVEKAKQEIDEQLIKLLQSDKEELKRWIKRMEYHCNKVNELRIELNKYQKIEEAKRLEKQMLKDIEIEKAITYLEDAIRNNCKLMPERNKELRKGLCEQNWHFRTAIEALKKQVPRKRTGKEGYSECPLCDTCAIGESTYKHFSEGSKYLEVNKMLKKKAILEFEYMPENCYECPLIQLHFNSEYSTCIPMARCFYASINRRHPECPLKPVEESNVDT